MKDVIVVGAGPAGVSLAIYLKRNNYNVEVFTTDNSMLKRGATIENYYGFPEINGNDLYDQGLKQLEGLSIPVLHEEVVHIEKNDTFTVKTNKGSYEAKIVVLANGIMRFGSGIKNSNDYEGKGLSFCASCDGFFYRNKKIAVIGSGNLAHEEVSILKNITSEVTLLTNGKDKTRSFDDLGVTINDSEIDRIIGESRVEGIELKNGEKILVDGIFIAVGMASGTTFSKTLGLITNGLFIVVDDDFMTNVDGIYAIGDAIGGTLQIGKAVADGINASDSIIKRLKNKDKDE